MMPSPAASQVQAGKVRPVVQTGKARAVALPNRK
jgi:tripartite-type tricarboxylate transporter receptor subunit TctC